MKILLGSKKQYVGSGYSSSVDVLEVVAKGELDVDKISKSVKSFRKKLSELSSEEGHEYCETMQWFRQTPEKVALHKKFGQKICHIVYDHTFLMITDAELI
jgi:hypothetical protein